MPTASPDLNDRERSCVEEILRSEKLAYVAMVVSSIGDEPRPYVVPMNFAYEPTVHSAASSVRSPVGRLLLHTGPGKKTEALAQNPRVCVSVTAGAQFRSGPTPCEDGYLYQSVILEGRAMLLVDDAQRDETLRAIVAKYDPAAASRPFDSRIFAQTMIYVVEVDTLSFKERTRST